jgi:hypothetical protein
MERKDRTTLDIKLRDIDSRIAELIAQLHGPSKRSETRLMDRSSELLSTEICWMQNLFRVCFLLLLSRCTVAYKWRHNGFAVGCSAFRGGISGCTWLNAALSRKLESFACGSSAFPDGYERKNFFQLLGQTLNIINFAKSRIGPIRSPSGI